MRLPAKTWATVARRGPKTMEFDLSVNGFSGDAPDPRRRFSDASGATSQTAVFKAPPGSGVCVRLAEVISAKYFT
jgi:hypothetical protein